MTIFAILSVLVIGYQVWGNYQLEKRWRCLRYCWQSMSDFAFNATEEGGHGRFLWEEALKEQLSLMARFGVRPLSLGDLDAYEGALLDRGIPVLVEQRR